MSEEIGNETEERNDSPFMDIEQAEKMIRERDEAKMAEFLTAIQDVENKFGMQLFIPEQPRQFIKVRRKV